MIIWTLWKNKYTWGLQLAIRCMCYCVRKFRSDGENKIQSDWSWMNWVLTWVVLESFFRDVYWGLNDRYLITPYLNTLCAVLVLPSIQAGYSSQTKNYTPIGKEVFVFQVNRCVDTFSYFHSDVSEYMRASIDKTNTHTNMSICADSLESKMDIK